VKLHSHKSSKVPSSPGKENNTHVGGRRKRVKREHPVETESKIASALDTPKPEEVKKEEE
jgi:hypothetical protein